MYERDICSVIVTRNDSERLLRQSVGIITARDFLHRVVVAQSKGPFKLASKDIMSTPLMIVNKDALTNNAIMLMKDKNITWLPVINEAGEVLEIVSLSTLIGKASDEDIDSVSAWTFFIGRTLHHTSFVLLDEWEDLLSSKVEGNLDARTVAIKREDLWIKKNLFYCTI